MSDGPDIPAPPSTVTGWKYRRWRYARRGKRPAVRLTNPVWDWLFQSQLDPYLAGVHFRLDQFPKKPRWSGTRLGQTKTQLDDGREFWVAGEHEDFYDPDFFIYNDVIVKQPNGKVEVYGYPEAVFVPTDFHSADLIDETRILLVGSLGYPGDRLPGQTQVICLDTDSLSITPIVTTGSGPGWIHSHQSSVDDGGQTLTVVRGKVWTGERIRENIDDWSLDLTTWQWSRLTDRNWLCVEVCREDDQSLHLWEISQIEFRERIGESSQASRDELRSEAGIEVDLPLYKRRYQPSVEHEEVVVDDEDGTDWNVHRVRIDGVVVRFNEEMDSVVITVEGDLAEEVVDRVAEELRTRLSTLENAPCRIERVSYD